MSKILRLIGETEEGEDRKKRFQSKIDEIRYMQEQHRTCPHDQTRIKIIWLNWPNNNSGTVVVCDESSKAGRCIKGRRYICEFQLTERC